MFWKRKVKCPITQEDKEWLEEWLDWIDNNVVDFRSQPTILPTKEYFDWTFTGTRKDAEFVLRKVGNYFKVDTAGIQLDLYSEESIELDRGTRTQTLKGEGTAGLFVRDGKKPTIWIEIQQLKRPNALVATLAHELSHYVLLSQKGVELEGEENEWLTDLLAIAYGFGVFMGNTRFELSQWQSGDGWGGWEYTTQGYLPQQIIAYAMAEIEVTRQVGLPDWIDLLRKDFQKDFRKSMKYQKANLSS